LQNPEFVENQEVQGDMVCNKDTGGLKTLQCWSRGIFFIVSAGGHIEYWQPLYRYFINHISATLLTISHESYYLVPPSNLFPADSLYKINQTNSWEMHIKIWDYYSEIDISTLCQSLLQLDCIPLEYVLYFIGLDTSLAWVITKIIVSSLF
jgi:hypothetical protein